MEQTAGIVSCKVNKHSYCLKYTRMIEFQKMQHYKIILLNFLSWLNISVMKFRFPIHEQVSH